jgi:hypothetical protein
MRGEKAGGDPRVRSFGLVLVLAVLAVPLIVVALVVLEVTVGRRPYVADPWAITRLIGLPIVAPPSMPWTTRTTSQWRWSR